MGPLEPAICLQGYYCPPSGKEQIRCPAGHFCPKGSIEPIKCSFAAVCPIGTYKDRSWLPLVLLIFVDLMLVTLAIAAKLTKGGRRQTQTKRLRRGSRVDGLPQRMRKALTFTRSSQFHRLSSNEVHLESRIAQIHRTPTGFMAEEGNRLSPGEDDDSDIMTEKEDPDILQFVQSLSKCTLASSFGLSFEFDNLKFQPKGCKKPVLSEVSGKIKSGTLWGVMGASGAGKSSFVNVLMGKQSYTGGVTKVNGVCKATVLLQ